MKIFVIGDIHFPFHNKTALKKTLAAIKKEKPTHVVQIGDLYDQYAFSRFSKKNIVLAPQELEQARAAARDMWSKIRKSCPRASLYQILGNHDIRLVKRAEERLPEAQEFVKKSLMEYYQFEGVRTIEDDTEELVIKGIIFIHGYRSKLGDHMLYNRASTVCGHSHTGGVIFKRLKGETLFELNAGFLADAMSTPLRYRMQKNTYGWTLGYGIISEKNGIACPQFIPL